MTNRKETPDDAENADNQQTKGTRRIKGSVYPRQDGRWGANFIVAATGKRKTWYAKTEAEAQGKLKKAQREQWLGILFTMLRNLKRK